ncbi:Uma2 family endonuclease [uncultured Lamprocystis sp.]|jgi:Uma2 family endonuclease|uniref:Uma2 family endonuclease n=1 Tax=uncultured Lamprocystis sp. TaxID=543132 RepID=UPI0025FED0CF|nr:Uma2 family endonuclease [uncultured Lamprocystis sp.]
MPTVIDPPAATDNAVQRILLEGIPWQRFEQLSACFENSRAIRLTYLDGRLEIMSPIGPEHETRKMSIGYLLEAYLTAQGIRFYGRGGFTLKQPGRAAGEPDQSYCIGADKSLPDLVIEVVITHEALSKFPLYQGLGIPEVWLWRNGDLEVYLLEPDGYRRDTRSRLLPDLDLALLAAHARMPDQYDAVQAFRRVIA